jgi:signal transduction histidine kinase
MSVRKKADLIRTTLLGDIAHSINTPLGTINSALQLLHMYMEKGDMKKMHSYHEIIEKNVFSIAENVSNLLTIYSLNKEDIKGMKEKVSIRNVLKSVIFSLEQNIEYKHINMHVDIPKEADEVFFIEKQLYSLLWNTVHNGVKYTENGDIFVTGRLHGKKICIGIRDTGKGIRKEDMGKIFQMFFSTGESAGGVGIGLNICRSIVDMYGGRINVSSEGPGKGTSINIVIPQ